MDPWTGGERGFWRALSPPVHPEGCVSLERRGKGFALGNVKQLDKVDSPIAQFPKRNRVRSHLVARIEGVGVFSQAQERHDEVAQDIQNDKATESGQATPHMCCVIKKDGE